MPEVDSYWRDLVSMALRSLVEDGYIDAANVIRKAKLTIELNNHIDWNGGIDYWDIVFQLRYRDYNAIRDKVSDIEGQLDKAIGSFHEEYSKNQIANVIIRQMVERFIDWQAVTPHTKESVISLLETSYSQVRPD